MKRGSLLLVFALALPVISNAQVVDFEDLAGTGVDNGGFITYGDHFTSGGFLFTDVTQPGNSVDFASWTALEGSPYTGSISPFLNYNSDSLQMTDGGATFSVSQIDLADIFLSNVNSTVTFTDNFGNQEFVTITDGTHLQSYALNFNNITSLTWNSGSIEWTQFDNIHTSAAPEPATFAAMGLGVLCLLRRRRQA